MRVVVVLPRSNTYCEHRPNSIETVVRTLLAQSRYRHDVTVVCDEGAAMPSRGKVVAVPSGLGRRRRNQAVARVIRQIGPDLIEHHQQLGRAAELARMFPKLVNVFYRHTSLAAPIGMIDRLRYHRRLAAFQRLVFVSRDTADEFSCGYPAFADRTAAICNPIDLDGWQAQAGEKEQVILFSGRAMQAKGLDLVCDALGRTLEAAPEWRAVLMLADWHIHRDWAEPHVRALERFGERVTIRPNAPLSEVKTATRRAAIALIPSRVREGLTLSALEAHAAGVALISSGRGGLREASGPHALYVEPTDGESLAGAIKALIDDPQRRQSMAAGGREHVARTHSAKVRAAELDDLRADLVQAHRPAPSPMAAPRPGARLAGALRLRPPRLIRAAGSAQ